MIRFKTVEHASLPQALYNIAKVAREDFITFFPEVFEALFKLCADSERNVQNAAQFLDNLIKARRPPPCHRQQSCTACMPDLSRLVRRSLGQDLHHPYLCRTSSQPAPASMSWHLCLRCGST